MLERARRVSYSPVDTPPPQAILDELEHWRLHASKVLKPDSANVLFKVAETGEPLVEKALKETAFESQIDVIFKGRLKGHNIRACVNSLMLADSIEDMNIDFPFDKENLAFGARFHDVGKLNPKIGNIIFPSMRIISWGDPEFEEEIHWIRQHPKESEKLVHRMSKISEATRSEIGKIARYHHERVDGNGYENLPFGDIPNESLIIAVGDAIDVMSGRRGYKGPPKNWGQIETELLRCSGSQFHPTVVTAAIQKLRIEPNERLFTYSHSYMH